jgi:DivIVA domain-containing protein
MATVFLILVVVLVVAGLVYGVVSLLSGDDPGLSAVEPDGRARPLPNNRSLSEFDLKDVRFDVGLRGYRMSQVDRVLRRTAYDLGYKDEMIAVLEAEVMALRDGRLEDAELLRKARESAASPAPSTPVQPDLVLPAEDNISGTADAAGETSEPDLVDEGETAGEQLPREGSLRRREMAPAENAPPSADAERSDSAFAVAAADAVGGTDPVGADDTVAPHDPVVAEGAVANDSAAKDSVANESAANDSGADDAGANDSGADVTRADDSAANDGALASDDADRPAHA